MPRRIDLEDDDEMPRRRRRSAKAAAIQAEEERGLVMRMLLHSPKDMIAGVLAAAAISAIVANALFLQAGRHPSPMFGTVTADPGAGTRARQSIAAPASGRGCAPHRAAGTAGANQAGRGEERRTKARRTEGRHEGRPHDHAGREVDGAPQPQRPRLSRVRRRRSRPAANRNRPLAAASPAFSAR